jgi:hypothetical protein
MIMSVTMSGREVIATWEESTSRVSAFLRWAVKRLASGGMVVPAGLPGTRTGWSSRARAPEGSPRVLRAAGRCEAAMTAQDLAGRSARVWARSVPGWRRFSGRAVGWSVRARAVSPGATAVSPVAMVRALRPEPLSLLSDRGPVPAQRGVRGRPTANALTWERGRARQRVQVGPGRITSCGRVCVPLIGCVRLSCRPLARCRKG